VVRVAQQVEVAPGEVRAPGLESGVDLALVEAGGAENEPADPQRGLSLVVDPL
jgi:hypothetical protein